MGLSKFLRNLGLGVKLSVMLVAAFVILLIATTLITSYSIGDLTAQTGQARASQEARVIQTRLAQNGQELLSNAKFMALNPALPLAVAKKDTVGIETILSTNAVSFNLDDLNVTDTTGRLAGALDQVLDASERNLLSLTQLGVEITDVISETEQGQPEFRMSAAVPLRDAQGSLVGGLLVSRKMDDKFMQSLNFDRDDIHLVLISNKQIAAQDTAILEPLPGLAEIVFNSATLDQALRGQTGVARNVIYSQQAIPHVVAHVPVMLRGTPRAVIAILIDLGDLAVFQRQWTRNVFITFGAVVLLLVLFVAVFARRNIGQPLRRLRAVAERVTGGDYAQRAEVTSSDEIGQLAGAFNTLTDQLQRTLTGLEQHSVELERRAVQLQASAEVSRAVSSILDADQLSRQVVELIRERFGLYYTGLFTVDPGGEWAVLRSGTGQAGQAMLARGHRIAVGKGMVGWSIASARARIAQDVSEDAVRQATAELPNTRSEAALPLRSRDRVLGALTLQSDQPNAFGQDVIAAWQTLADQIAVALDNARLFAESQAAIETTRRAYGEISRTAWAETMRVQAARGYTYDRRTLVPATGDWQPDMQQATQTGLTIVEQSGPEPTLAIPLKVRGQVIGVIGAHKAADAGEWTAEETTLLETLTEQLGVALDSARLYQDTQRRAAREQIAAQVTGRMRESLEVNQVLDTAASELRRALGLAALDIRLTALDTTALSTTALGTAAAGAAREGGQS